MKVIISEDGRSEIDRLQFDIEKSIAAIFTYIPKGDIIGLGHILVTDFPLKRKGYNHKALGAYFKQEVNRPSHIKLYARNLFGHLKSAESLRQMLPIQELGLAQTIYHEIGHHVRQIRAHGLKKNRSENFSNLYAQNALSRYVLDNSKSINCCFAYLKSISNDKGLSLDVIRNMEGGWERSYKEALKAAKPDK